MKCECAYEVWISRDDIVDFLLYAASLDASVATRSKISETRIKSMKALVTVGHVPLTKELSMDMARLEIPVSGCTCLRTKPNASVNFQIDG